MSNIISIYYCMEKSLMRVYFEGAMGLWCRQLINKLGNTSVVADCSSSTVSKAATWKFSARSHGTRRVYYCTVQDMQVL